MKELNQILSRTKVGSNLYQPRRTIKDTEPSQILKMNPTLSLSLTLKLHPARKDVEAATAKITEGNADRVLVKNNFYRDSVSHMAVNVFHIFTTAMSKCTIVTLLDDSNLNAF